MGQYHNKRCRGIASTHQTIADRRSQVADDRKESCFHIIADNRKRSQSRLLHTFRSAEVSKLHARCAGRKVAANNMADVEKELLLQANLFLLLVLKRRHRQLQNRLKTSASATDKLNYSPIFFQQLAFLFLSLKS